MDLHLLSNGKMSLKEFSEIAKKVDSYVDFFHIREKQKSAKELYEGVQSLLDKGIDSKKIFMNDRVDVAVALGLRGVQLAYHSLPLEVVRKEFPTLAVGCSVHSQSEIRAAEQGGASFAVYGHIFPTNSKPNLMPRGLEELKTICSTTQLPIIAIGGITPENTLDVLRNGANGIAVISGILQQRDPVYAAEQFKEQMFKWEEEQHEKTL
ncbi:thiazole tautomerase TenI [Bacillus sp. AK128]